MRKNAHFMMHIGISLIGIMLSLNCGAAVADVVAVVSAKSASCTLSRRQVTDLFLGKTVRLPNGAQAVPIDQTDGSSVRDEFYARFAGKSEAQIRAYWASLVFTGRGRPPQEASSDAEVKHLIANNSHAIGYIERDQVDDTVRVCSDRP